MDRLLVVLVTRCGGEVDRCDGIVADERLFHQASDLELYSTLRWHLYRCERFGVLSLSSAALLNFKNAKIPKLKSISLAKLHDDRVQKTLNDFLDYDPLFTGRVGDMVNEFFFSNCGHASPYQSDD